MVAADSQVSNVKSLETAIHALFAALVTVFTRVSLIHAFTH